MKNTISIKLPLILAFLLTVNLSFSQDLSLKWSEKMTYTNQKNGFFNDFIETNDEYVYANYNNLALNPKKADNKMKIIAYDKNTMKEKASVALRGYKENASQKAAYSDLDYLKTIIFKEEVLVFWTKKVNSKTDKKTELYVESYTSELKREKKLKKIFTSKTPDDVKTSRFAGSSIIVLANKEAGEQLIIGAEVPQTGDNIIFKYLVLDKELEVSDESEVELPIVLKGKNYGLSSSYTYGKDGNIYVNSIVTLTKEEIKKAKKEAKKEKKAVDYSYAIFTAINVESGDATSFEIRDENKIINDFDYVITEKGIKVYGFFCDLQKDAKGGSIHGFFHNLVDSKTLEETGLNYTYFDKSVIDELFKNDTEDKKKTTGSKKKKTANAANDAESLDTRFGIEEILVTDNDEVILMCSKMYNYSVTTCNSKGQCTTRYYCQKSNVTGIRISNEGEIVWASNVDRLFTFSGWYVYDLRTVMKNDKLYVIYASAFDADAEEKNRKSKKKMSEYRDNFEYATFDLESGKYKKNTFQVNSNTTEKKDRKSVSPTKIEILDDKFYVEYTKTRQKIGWCVANVICFPTLYYSMLSGDTRVGHGNLGVISVIK